MTEFLLSFVILMTIVAMMAVGVMRGRAPISGTCGGLNNLGVDGSCEICGGNPTKCEQESTTPGKGSFFDAS